MADDSIIKEFLIALGFKVDSAGLRKFGDGIVTATKAVAGIAVATASAAASVVTFTTKAAESFEKLYFASQRAGTTALNMSSLRYGFEQIGLGADAATQTLETFALSLKTNPAMEGFLRQIGVATRDKNGMRDTTDIMLDFTKKLSSMPPWLAAQWAQMFGISAQQLFQMQRYSGELAESQRRYKEEARAFGVNLDEYAAKSHGYMTGLRQLGNDLDMIWMRVAGTLITEFEPELEKIHQLFVKHQNSIINLGVAFGERIKIVLDSFLDIFNTIDCLTSGTITWQDAITDIGKHISDLILYPFRQTWELIQKIYGLMPKISVGKVPIDPEHPGLGTKDEGLGGFFGGVGDKIKEFWHDFFKAPIDMQLYMPMNYSPVDAGGNGIMRASYTMPGGVGGGSGSGGGGGGSGGGPVTPQGVGGSLADRGKYVMDALIKGLGLTAAQAAGVASNLAAESGIQGIESKIPVGPGQRGGFGIAQWAGSRRRDFEKWTTDHGLNIASLDTNTQYLLYELKTKFGPFLARLKGTHTAQEAAKLFFKEYESGGAASLQRYEGSHLGFADSFLKNYSLGQGVGSAPRPPVTMHQKTDIHVHGGDAKAIGQEVAVRQRGVHADMIRNLSNAAVFA